MATPENQLIFAARDGNIERVGALLDQGVDVDSRDDALDTLLIWAIRHGNRAVAALLLDREANVNAEDVNGATPAILASYGGHLDTLQLLVARGADIHHRTQGGWSSLLAAALYDHQPVCEYLLSLGADLMAASNNWTALTHYGRFANPATKAIRCATLQRAWENGPHPSQVQRRIDERWERRGSFLTVLAEHAYRPLQARALEITLAALSLDLNEAIVISTNPKEIVLRDEGLVRYIVAFL